MGKITKYLNQLIAGNVFDSPEILEAYATDRSVLKIKPKFVALPESTEDIQKLVKFFYQLATKDIKVPIAVRGAGLDEMGADLSSGLVISTEKLNRLLESDRRERLVRVQSGITLRELNTALSMHGLTIPIGGHDMETIGGLIASCPVDDYANKYGGIMNYVERVEVVLANGDILQTNRYKKRMIDRKTHEKTFEGDIYRKLSKIVRINKDLIDEIEKNTKDLSGYNNITKTNQKKTLDLMPLFFGSEGTLGIISEVILRAVPIQKRPLRVLAVFDGIVATKKFFDSVKTLRPRELGIYDLNIIKTVEETGKQLDELTKKVDSGFVAFACFDGKTNACFKKINNIKKNLPRNSKLIIESSANRFLFDDFSNSMICFMNYLKNEERLPLVINFYLPERNLNNFLDDLKILEEKLGLELSLFGSYATSNYNLRPKFKLEDEELSKKILTFLRAGAFIIERQGGSIAGGSPEGRVKAIITNSKLSNAEKNLYEEIKNVFDRYGILNPEAKLGADTRSTLRHFRDTSLPKIMV